MADDGSASAGDPGTMSVKDLKAVLTERGVSYADCYEKSDLVQRVTETKDVIKAAAGSASASPNPFSKKAYYAEGDERGGGADSAAAAGAKIRSMPGFCLDVTAGWSIEVLPPTEVRSGGGLGIGLGGKHLVYGVKSMPRAYGGAETFSTETARVSNAGYFASVERRFKDFEWLAEMLAADFPGALLPPLPPSSSGGDSSSLLLMGAGAMAMEARQSAEFLAARTRGLTSFLRRTAQHGELRHAAVLRAFLAEADDGAFGEAKRLAVQQRSASAQERLKKAGLWARRKMVKQGSIALGGSMGGGFSSFSSSSSRSASLFNVLKAGASKKEDQAAAAAAAAAAASAAPTDAKAAAAAAEETREGAAAATAGGGVPGLGDGLGDSPAEVAARAEEEEFAALASWAEELEARAGPLAATARDTHLAAAASAKGRAAFGAAWQGLAGVEGLDAQVGASLLAPLDDMRAAQPALAGAGLAEGAADFARVVGAARAACAARQTARFAWPVSAAVAAATAAAGSDEAGAAAAESPAALAYSQTHARAVRDLSAFRLAYAKALQTLLRAHLELERKQAEERVALIDKLVSALPQPTAPAPRGAD